MRQLILLTFCISCAFSLAQAQGSNGVTLESFFNESTLLKGVTYLSQDEIQQDELKVRFKSIQPYKPQWLQGEQVEINFLNSRRYSNLKQIKMPQAYMQEGQDWLFSNQGCWFSGQQFESFSQGAVINLKLERGVFLGKSKSYYYNKNTNEEEYVLPKEKSSKANTPYHASNNLPPVAKTMTEKIEAKRDFLPNRYDEFLLEGQSLNIDFNAQKSKSLQVFTKQEFDQVSSVADSSIPEKAEEKETMIIENDNGIFFDQQSGYVIYYGPVKLKHPEYNLTCQGDLQIKLTQEKSQTPERSIQGKVNKNQSGLEYARAQGNAVLITLVEQGGETKKIISKGDIIEIFGEDEIIKVKGGYPSLIQAGTKLQAGEESLYYQIDRAGSLITSKGRWKTEILDLDQLSN